MVGARGTAGARRPGVEPVSGRLAVDFVNTVACPGCHVRDALDSRADLARWTRAHPEVSPAPVSALALNRLRGFRSDLRGLFERSIRGQRPSRASVERLNLALRRASTHLEVRWARDRCSLNEALEIGDGENRWFAVLGRSMAEVLSGSGRQKLRSCRGPGCAHYLLARTRGQLWCSPTGCGNRVRVARHYRKARGDASLVGP